MKGGGQCMSRDLEAGMSLGSLREGEVSNWAGVKS